VAESSIDFVERAERRAGRLAAVPALTDWQCQATVLLLQGDSASSMHLTSAGWSFELNAVVPAYTVTVEREGWSREFTSRYTPGEPIEQTLRREGAMAILASLLAAAFGMSG
jgi:hypothetical protein